MTTETALYIRPLFSSPCFRFLRFTTLTFSILLHATSFTPSASAQGSELPAAELLEVPYDIAGDSDDRRKALEDFITFHMTPRHAVAVAVVRKGSKRHFLLKEIAADEDLRYMLAIGVAFSKGKDSLTVNRRDGSEVYSGKWTRGAIRAWLEKTAYPLVNSVNPVFIPNKYTTSNSYGAVFVSKPVAEHTDELQKALEPFAKQFHDKLKFTMFVKTDRTEVLCNQLGVRTNNELLIIEKPKETQPNKRRGSHTHRPLSPRYRLENVTEDRLKQFFQEYSEGKLTRYLKSTVTREEHEKQKALAATKSDGLLYLTGWDFLETVQDPEVSVLVEFVSSNCDACVEFDDAYREVARRVESEKKKGAGRSMLSRTIVVRMNQSANEHTEDIKGTPWLKYWGRSKKKKKALDVELRSVESIMSYLEEQAEQEAEESAKPEKKSKKKSKASKDSVKDAAGQESLKQKSSTAAPSVNLGQPQPDEARGYMSTDAEL
eukprot:TRINITY_DN93346_c0_g1_i1.p1 TRINITY_DN93346_c0_g1~~TRINITY_DN93346_c0_g1_i1.p1  ORF type:complete len:526 (-),score=94.59 TRINITY_DN93346_c0_g1_i1:216-1682(-)